MANFPKRKRISGDEYFITNVIIVDSQLLDFCFGSWVNLKITETFTPVGAGRLLYRFTVLDPTKWDRPWGGEYEFRPANSPIEEYACREGEVSVPAMLRGARVLETREAAKKGEPN